MSTFSFPDKYRGSRTDTARSNLVLGKLILDPRHEALWGQDYRLKDPIKQLPLEPEVEAGLEKTAQALNGALGSGLDRCCNIAISLTMRSMRITRRFSGTASF
jgi:hypothetical protein